MRMPVPIIKEFASVCANSKIDITKEDLMKGPWTQVFNDRLAYEKRAMMKYYFTTYGMKGPRKWEVWYYMHPDLDAQFQGPETQSVKIGVFYPVEKRIQGQLVMTMWWDKVTNSVKISRDSYFVSDFLSEAITMDKEHKEALNTMGGDLGGLLEL